MPKQRLASSTPFMIAETEGNIGWMIFNNPDKHNAVKAEMWEAIPQILDTFEANDAVKVVVLKGAGEKAFISGADISEFEQVRSSESATKHYEDIADTATDRLYSCTKPTIAMIRGYCIGGGAGIAVSCDLRIATEASRFGIPAAKLSVGYRYGGIRKLVDLVGPSAAKDIFFTARQVPAPEALTMGLINRMVPDHELEAMVQDYCQSIGANAPLTITAVKQIVGQISKPGGFDQALCEQLVENCFSSEDYIEGRRAFMEKRKPVFKGH